MTRCPEREALASPTPKITVITVCKNSARYVETAVRSVLEQDYPNLEFIVQDGGSTDGTLDVFRRYGDRIHVVSEPDRGFCDGVDRALRRVSGDIFGFLLWDEKYLPGALRFAADGFRLHPSAGIVYGDCRLVDSRYREISLYAVGQVTFEQVFCVERVIPAAAMFIRTACMREVGMHSDPSLAACADFELVVRLGLKYPIVHVPGLISENMVHSGSMTCRPALYDAFVRDKAAVIQRVLNDPATPERIRRLGRRAFAGLFTWAGLSLERLGHQRSLYWLRRAFQAEPIPSRFVRLALHTFRLSAYLPAWRLPKSTHTVGKEE